MAARRTTLIGLTVLAVAVIGFAVERRAATDVPTDVSALVAAGDHRRLSAMLTAGAEPDGPIEGGMTPLMRAAARDDVDSIELLVEAGATVDLPGLEGMTALHVAARADAAEAWSALVAAGSDTELRSSNGMAAIHHAAAAGAGRVMNTLRGMDVDLDARSTTVVQGHGHPRDAGPTALAIAVRAGHPEVVRALLEAGANVDATSDRGITALLTAVFADGDPELVQFLLDAGADTATSVGCTEGCSSNQNMAAAGWAAALDRDALLPLLDP